MMKIVALLIVLSKLSMCCGQCNNADQFDLLKWNMVSRLSDKDQARNARDLVERLLPNRHKDFVIDIQGGNINSSLIDLLNTNNGCDVARVESLESGRVRIVGSSGVAAAWALNQYLKYHCNCHVSWDVRQLESLPETLPFVNFTLRATDLIRYYQNVCEYGYSFVWWNWSDWEKHIDWAALNGINLILTASGQEAIWKKTFMAFNMTDKEIRSHFTGPAFLPWNRMGNLRSWAGPLPLSWIENDRKLQHKITQRARGLGMKTVVPAFSGIVPERINELYPEVSFVKLRKWGHFSEKYSSSSLIDVESKLFQDIGRTFISLYEAEYSTDHFYGMDTFNEMNPVNASQEYLSSYSKAVMQMLKSTDHKAIWVMQGWMFINDFWSLDKAESLLNSIPQGRLLVLDLASTTDPQFYRLKSYFGQPFIYCMLHNFGGTLGLYGKSDVVYEGPHLARINSSSMVGTGITPEGIHNSYVMYDLMLESSWKNQSGNNINQWFDQYVSRRYGLSKMWNLEFAKEAWRYLAKSAYNCCQSNNYLTKKSDYFWFHGHAPIEDLPSLSLEQDLWYDPADVTMAWDLMIASIVKYEPSLSTCSDPFVYDLVDVTRQAMANMLYPHYVGAVEGFNLSSATLIRQAETKFLEILRDLDHLLSTCEGFTLGRWLESAKALGQSKEERMLYEFNARNQITLWGPEGNVLDYAAKQWGGLIRSYYLPRWHLFFRLLKGLAKKKSLRWKESRFRHLFLNQIGKPFTLQRNLFPVNATGYPLEIAIKLHRKWRPDQYIDVDNVV